MISTTRSKACSHWMRRVEQVGLDVVDRGSGVAVTRDPRCSLGDVEAGGLEAASGDVLCVGTQTGADDDALAVRYRDVEGLCLVNEQVVRFGTLQGMVMRPRSPAP